MNFDRIKEEIKKQEEFKVKQQKLHDKHKNIDSDVVIVEKSSLVKFLIKLTISIFKTLLAIMSVLLCAVGVISLIYPNIRKELFITLSNMLNDLTGLIGN